MINTCRKERGRKQLLTTALFCLLGFMLHSGMFWGLLLQFEFKNIGIKYDK